jgi:SAM-dependent methyltransferase
MLPSWSELRHAYNYHTLPERRTVLIDLLRVEAADLRTSRSCLRALDIGSGTGMGHGSNGPEHLARIRAFVDTMWGVEPDPDASPPEGMLDHIYRANLEELDLKVKGERVALAYSHLVQEHVPDAYAFFRALARHLEPGGVYYGLTINGRHLFARITRFLHWLCLDEWVLRVFLRQQYGLEYHYPTLYRCNEVGKITDAALAAGFLPPTFVYMEGPGDAAHYFVGPLRHIYALMQWKRRTLHRPHDLLTLIVRVEKPSLNETP